MIFSFQTIDKLSGEKTLLDINLYFIVFYILIKY